MIKDELRYDIAGFPYTRKLIPNFSVSPPENKDSRYLDSEGNPNARLLQIKDQILQEWAKYDKSRRLEGIYCVGSVAAGNFNEDSDVDFYIKGKVGYEEGKNIAGEISKKINPVLANWKDIFRAKGIDPENPNRQELERRKLIDRGMDLSTIIILHRLGHLNKKDIIDLTVGAGIPWGRVYDFQKNGWFKYREGNKMVQKGSMSDFFAYGF